MKDKKEIISDLTLSQNLRLAMTKEGLTFKDIAVKAKVSENTVFRLVERTPLLITKQLISIGKCLGFTEKQVREKVQQERLLRSISHSKKSRFYQLLNEIIKVFEAK